MKTFKSYISGSWISTKSGITKTLHNPADTNQLTGKVEYAGGEIAQAAMDAAKDAWNCWREYPVAKRIEILSVLLEIIKQERDEIAKIITTENGKTLRESYSEIDSALNEAEYQTKFLSKSIVEHISNHEIRYEPLGVVLLITPWNFPLATILRKLVPALAVGNTVVVKPSELTPMTADALFRIIDRLGFPKGAINMLIGEGNVSGPVLCKHPALRAVSLTGSSYTGANIARQIRDYKVKFQAEMGGKNAVVVLEDADLDEAANAVVQSGFACCGQWCTGTSRVIVEKPVYEKFINMLVEKTGRISTGDGFNKSVTMGPLISKAQLDRVEAAVLNAKKDGAKLLAGGKRPGKAELSNGYFFEPTIFADVKPGMNIAQEEIFGPVIAVLAADNMDEALSIANNSKYGLAFSVYTKSKSAAGKFMNEVNAGVCHINLPTSFRDPALPLYGWGNSGCGLPESGRFARDFFTKTKAIYKAQ